MNRKTTMDELNNTELVTQTSIIHSLSYNNNNNNAIIVNDYENDYDNSYENDNENAISVNDNHNGNSVGGENSACKKYGYKKSILEILISVAIHTFIMAVFEIYFYFEYIVVIEKQLFMDKIHTYTNEANQYITSSTRQEVILLLFPQENTKWVLASLYKDYQKSLHDQRQLLEILLIRSYKMLAVITTILVCLLSAGIYKYKEKIKWKHIMAENILMFLCLGIFEYMFFINIILHYTPVTDEEIKYTVVKELVQPFLNTTRRLGYKTQSLSYA